jgi:hypothetical protein
MENEVKITIYNYNRRLRINTKYIINNNNVLDEERRIKTYKVQKHSQNGQYFT